MNEQPLIRCSGCNLDARPEPAAKARRDNPEIHEKKHLTYE